MNDQDRLARLCAIEDIKQLKARYWRMIDHYGDGLLEGLFAQDATIDFMKYGVLSGRAAIAAFYRTQVFPAYSMMIHHGANPEITVLGPEEAEGRWQYEAWMLGKDGVGYWHAGWYDDRYRFEDGAWRISYSKGQHHFNIRVEDQWARQRFENDEWPPRPR